MRQQANEQWLLQEKTRRQELYQQFIEEASNWSTAQVLAGRPVSGQLSLPVCPTGPPSSQLIEAKQLIFVLETRGVLEKSAVKLRGF